MTLTLRSYSALNDRVLRNPVSDIGTKRRRLRGNGCGYFQGLQSRRPDVVGLTFYLFGVVLCFTTAGCSALPETFTRVDGRALDPTKLSIDEAICRGEIKNNLSTANQITIGGPTEDAIAIYMICMAENGYRPK